MFRWRHAGLVSTFTVNFMFNYFMQVLQGMADYGWRIFYASMIFFVAEMAFGRNRYSLRSRFTAALFWVFYVGITVSFYVLFGRIWGSLGIKPLLSLNLGQLFSGGGRWLQVVGWIVMPVFTAILGEFFYYWFHRLQHKSAFLWAFHSEHHALREMSAWSSNHHFTEEIFRVPFVLIPISLLFQVDVGVVPALVGLIIGLQGQFEHSHTKLNLGPLRYVVADNRFHRIHHSVERHHYDKNFGSFTSIWDSVFGTAYFPAKDEWPDTGIDAHDGAKTVSDFLFRPFRKLRGKSAA